MGRVRFPVTTRRESGRERQEERGWEGEAGGKGRRRTEFHIPVGALWQSHCGPLDDLPEGCFDLLVHFDVEEEGWGIVDFGARAGVG